MNTLDDRLKEAIRKGNLFHAYIIEGDSISGKEDFALEFAKKILCLEKNSEACGLCECCKRIENNAYPDLYIIEPEGVSVKDGAIEELQEELSKIPLGPGGRNIAIIYEADTMTKRAQNRILKTLEEPYPGTVIMLLAENSDTFISTIKSRCQLLRVYGGEREPSSEDKKWIELGTRIIEKLLKKEYFFELQKELEANVSGKREALSLLDAMEEVARNMMIESEDSSKVDFAIKSIPQIENARTDLKYNIRDKYALSDLMLKMGGYI